MRAAVVERLRVVALLAAAAAASGCLTKPALVPQSFSIDAPPPRPDGSADGVVLTLARVEVAPPYSGQALVYRVGEHGFERDPYARFTAPPGWLLTAAIRGYLANADFVRDVVAPGDRARSAALIQASVTQLAGELRGSEPAAALTLRFRVLSGTGPGGRPEILLKSYAKAIPIRHPAARDVVDGWNQGLAEIMEAFQADLKKALTEVASHQTAR
jgi:hypothetical protein